MRLSRPAAFLVRLALTCGAFAALYMVTDVKGALALIVRADPLPLLAAIALLVIRVPLMAWRWEIILEALGICCTLGELTRIVFASVFLGTTLPTANGSDLVRVFMLKTPGATLIKLAGSILVDRIYGVLTMALIAVPAAILLIAHGHGANTAKVAIGGAALIIAVVGLFATAPAIARHQRLQEAPTGSVLARIGEALLLLGQTLRPFQFVMCVALSLVTQVMAIVSVICGSMALHLGEPLVAYFAFVPIVWLLTLLPLSLSGLGVREASFAVLFDSLGSTGMHGVAIGAITSLTTIAAAAIGGIALLLKPVPSRGGEPTTGKN